MNGGAGLSVDDTNLYYAEKRSSQWEFLMRKFCEVHKDESMLSCNSKTVEIPTVFRSQKVFPTNSKYEGSWNVLGISGYGVYTFPNGVIYEGHFNDGMFDGVGEMRYPDGTKIRGVWCDGINLDPTLVYGEEMPYDEEDWTYCKMPDRRFSIEKEEAIQPSGKSFLTNAKTAVKIPNGYYDTGDGFYDPTTKCIFHYDDLASIVRIPIQEEQDWIVQNCRTAPDLPIGCRPDLYEEFQRAKLQIDKLKPNETSMRNFYDPEAEYRAMSDETISSQPQRIPMVVPEGLFAFQNSPYLSF